MPKLRFCSLALLVSLITSVAHAAPGDFDLSFGQNGIFRLPNASLNREFATFVTTAPDGKLVVTGGYYAAQFGGDILARLNANGQLDTTFASVGYGRSTINPQINTSGQAAYALADGRIVQVQTRSGLLCGESGRPACSPGQISSQIPFFHSQRFENQGALDPLYGVFGSMNAGGDYRDVLADADGTLTLYGRGGFPELRPLVLRYSAEGLPLPGPYDRSATNALSLCMLPASQTNASTVRAVRSGDGKAYVILQLNVPDRYCVLRLLADGTPDITWGNGGASEFALGAQRSAFDRVVGLAIRPNGGLHIVFAGHMGIPRVDTSRTTIATFAANGFPDTTWGAGGIRALATGLIAQAFAITVQADGKLLVAGSPFGAGSFFPSPDADLRPRIARLQLNGETDLTFGAAGNGYVALESMGYRLSPSHLSIAADGNILVVGAGYSADPANVAAPSQFAVAKLLAADPPPAPASPQASGGGGGCGSINTRLPPDPTLPGIALLAALWLSARRRPRVAVATR